jgi:Tfp pilus assembly protein PilF
MKTFFCLISLLICLIGCDAKPLPLNEMPMYGGIEKTDNMKECDAAFIKSIEKDGQSRERASLEIAQAGWVYYSKGDLTTAIKRFNQAWLVDPENSDAYHGFALIIAERDKSLTESEKYFRIALAKKNVSANAHVDYGRLLSLQNRFDESMVQLNQALAISPKVRNARTLISVVYYKKGDFTQACEWAKSARINNDALEYGYLDDMCHRIANK